MPHGPPFTPEISAAFTVAPEVVYSPIVPAPIVAAPKFVTKIVSARAALVESSPNRT
jgi:hypothetical protein